jgi:hypothetical protein
MCAATRSSERPQINFGSFISTTTAMDPDEKQKSKPNENLFNHVTELSKTLTLVITIDLNINL